MMVSDMVDELSSKFYGEIGALAAGLNAHLDSELLRKLQDYTALPLEPPWRPNYRDSAEEYFYIMPRVLQVLGNLLAHFAHINVRNMSPFLQPIAPQESLDWSAEMEIPNE